MTATSVVVAAVGVVMFADGARVALDAAQSAADVVRGDLGPLPSVTSTLTGGSVALTVVSACICLHAALTRRENGLLTPQRARATAPRSTTTAAERCIGSCAWCLDRAAVVLVYLTALVFVGVLFFVVAAFAIVLMTEAVVEDVIRGVRATLGVIDDVRGDVDALLRPSPSSSSSPPPPTYGAMGTTPSATDHCAGTRCFDASRSGAHNLIIRVSTHFAFRVAHA